MATKSTPRDFSVRLKSGNTANPNGASLFKQAWTDTITGSDNPAWRSQVRSRKTATTVMNGVKTTVTGRPASFQYTVTRRSDGKEQNRAWHEELSSASPPSQDVSVALARCKDIASMKLANLARKELMSVSGPTIIGELSSTLQMLRSPFKALVGEILRLNRRIADHKRIRYSDKDIVKKGIGSSTHLEVVMGVLPLISDIQGLLQAYVRATEPPRPKTVLQGYHEERIPGTNTTVNGLSAWTYCRWSRTTTSETRVQAIATGGLSAQVLAQRGLAERLIRESGFILSELPSVAWNLIPMSFLVDYVINVGNLLASGALVDGTLGWVQMTTRVTRIANVDITPQGPPPLSSGYEYSTQIGTPGTYRYESTSVSRVPGGTSVGLHFNLPSTRQLVNVAALLRQADVTR